MSFILDALKKSENERQGQRGLGVADVPVAREAPGAPAWIWWLLGLLAVNVVVLLAVLLRPGAEPTADASTDPPAAAPAETRTATVPERVAPELAALVDRTRTERLSTTPPDSGYGSPDEEPARAAAATPAAVMPAADAADDAEAADAVRAESGSPDRDAAQQPQAPAAGSRTGAAASGEEQALTLPTLDELRVRGDTGLPDLHLDIHVWSEQPRGRFVYVNTTKYREGDDLTEGPRVASIVRNGVVLEHDGRRFLLPRD
ncbi:general secretion pathway protein GspB [Lentisalinibacter orientalis]|uniref:general secretion pathway protein GspB n=1 Tax=Lentisalinibacter orientalis TaxID=2992241 RepID=UPI0038678909